MRLTDERLWNSSCLWRTAKNICRASRVFTKFASEPNPDWCTGQPAEPIENPANADEIALAMTTENLLGTKIKKLKRKKKNLTVDPLSGNVSSTDGKKSMNTKHCLRERK